MNKPPAKQTLPACAPVAATNSSHENKPRASRTYCPYGYISKAINGTTPLGFHGELLIESSGIYLLGNGYRAYSPLLKRFLCSDSYSPFGRGGLNSYVAFLGNPVNFLDPDGHVSITLAQANSLLQSKAIGFASRRRVFASKYELAKHRILHSDLPERPGRDLASLQVKTDVGPANFSIVGNPVDLKHIGRRPQKFIFTNQAELIIGESGPKVDFAHPHLTYFAGGEKQVVSAGMIMRDDDGLMLTNDTGHYHRSAEGIDTLTAPLAFLQELGVKAVRLSQNTGLPSK